MYRKTALPLVAIALLATASSWQTSHAALRRLVPPGLTLLEAVPIISGVGQGLPSPGGQLSPSDPLSDLLSLDITMSHDSTEEVLIESVRLHYEKGGVPVSSDVTYDDTEFPAFIRAHDGSAWDEDGRTLTNFASFSPGARF